MDREKIDRLEVIKMTILTNRILCIKACGVTPQMVVEAAGDKIDGLVFAHEPGHMLVTDWTTEDLDKLRPGF